MAPGGNRRCPSGPGAGIRILNQPTPKPFKESMDYGMQNLYARAKELVGDAPRLTLRLNGKEQKVDKPGTLTLEVEPIKD
jgi:hypothetical protein